MKKPLCIIGWVVGAYFAARLAVVPAYGIVMFILVFSKLASADLIRALTWMVYWTHILLPIFVAVITLHVGWREYLPGTRPSVPATRDLKRALLLASTVLAVVVGLYIVFFLLYAYFGPHF